MGFKFTREVDRLPSEGPGLQLQIGLRSGRQVACPDQVLQHTLFFAAKVNIMRRMRMMFTKSALLNPED